MATISTPVKQEHIIYIYTCPTCGKFKEEPRRNDGLVCSCGEPMVMSKPEQTIKHYKKDRRLYSILTILFTILLPIATLCSFMFAGKHSQAEVTHSLNYNLPILFFVLMGAIILKGRSLLDKVIANTDNVVVRAIIVFFIKNSLYIIIIGILIVMITLLTKLQNAIIDHVTIIITNLKKSLDQVVAALTIVTIENAVGYCWFDYKHTRCTYLIDRALRQAETIQAMEMSNR